MPSSCAARQAVLHDIPVEADILPTRSSSQRVRGFDRPVGRIEGFGPHFTSFREKHISVMLASPSGGRSVVARPRSMRLSSQVH